MDLQYINGPNQIIPAKNLYTSDLNGSVKLREPQNVLPTTSLPGKFIQIAEKYPNKIILAYKDYPDQKGFIYVTLREYYEKVRTMSKAFINLGLKRNGVVLMLARNCPKWLYSYYASLFAGGCGGGMYTSMSAEACFQSCAKVAVQIVVVDDSDQAAKILKYKSQLTSLKAIIQMEGDPENADVLKWSDVEEIGKGITDDLLNERLKRIAINQCCSIVFTSGTLGEPKAAMLCHDSLYFNIASTLKLGRIDSSDKTISYLPLSHIVAQLYDLCAPIVYAPYTVYFAEKEAIKGTIFKTIRQVRPTFFVGVPRIAEKLTDLIKEHYLDLEKNTIKQWALQVVNQRFEYLTKGAPMSDLAHVVAKNLVFKKVKAAIGMDRIKLFTAGAATVTPSVKKWCLAADLVLQEIYGLTETSGPVLFNKAERGVLHYSGQLFDHIKLKIIDPDHNGEGELCFSSRCNLMGYVNEEEKTKLTIDEDGYVHSGDMGYKGPNGYIMVTGRCKEIVVTSGGENVAPVYIESIIKGYMPFISQAMVVGDNRKFITVLLTLGCVFDTVTGKPTDELNELSKKWLNDLGFPFQLVSEVIGSGPHPTILDSIQKGINSSNEKSISHAQNVQKFRILPVDFSHVTGELGPTLKLKRHVVLDKYKNIIDAMYN